MSPQDQEAGPEQHRQRGFTALGTLGAAFKIAAKELLESFRDRQTLLYTFVLPVCMYPAMLWVVVQGALVVQGQKGAENVTLGVAAPDEIFESVATALGPEFDGPEEHGRVTIVPVSLTEGTEGTGIERFKALVEDDAANAPDAIVVLPNHPGAGADEDSRAKVYFDSTDSGSEIARGRAVSALERWSEDLRTQALEERDIDPAALDPIEIHSNSVAEKKDGGAVILSVMLPLLLIVMSVLGAFFPAVDLTAGEKERGTAETTMLLPVPRVSMHLGKILAVAATAMIATVLNLLALGLSAGHLMDQLAGATGGGIEIQLPLGALVSIMPLAVLFAFFVSATLTAVASLAASFKEGQALLGPVQMVFMLPAMATTLPGLTLTAKTALIPVVNVALAFRGMLVGDARAVPLAICALSLSLLALLAIGFAIRIRSNEQVALAGETLSLRKLGALLRPSKNPKNASAS